MKKIYSTEECLEYMIERKNLFFASEENKKIFLKYLKVHGVNNIITVYKHYFCTDKKNGIHIYDNKTNIMEYKKKIDKDKENTNFMWDKIILLERLLKTEIYEQVLKEYKSNGDLHSEDIYTYLIELCEEKIKYKSENQKSYYTSIIKAIKKNKDDKKEFYYLIKELNWGNIISFILLLDKKRREEIYDKYDIKFENLNQFRILRNNIAHGDYLTIYLNKEIYDSEEYDKTELISKVLKIIKKNYVYDEKEFSEFNRKLKLDFSTRKKFIKKEQT